MDCMNLDAPWLGICSHLCLEYSLLFLMLKLTIVCFYRFFVIVAPILFSGVLEKVTFDRLSRLNQTNTIFMCNIL